MGGTISGGNSPVVAAWSNPYNASFTVPLSKWFPQGVIEAPWSANTVAMMRWFTVYGPYQAVGINTQPLAIVPEYQALVPVSGNSANFSQAPIPGWVAKYITGSGDSPLLIYQPSRNLSWEMWGSHSSGGAWSTSDGYQGTNMQVSTGGIDAQYHESAAGLTYIGTIITNMDVLRAEAMDASGAGGDLGHVLALQVSWESEPFLPPALTRDGGVGNTPFAPQEGAWYYIPSNVAMPSGMCPLAQYLFRTLQRYGAIVVDVTQGQGIYFVMENPGTWSDQGYSGTAPIDTALNGQQYYAAFDAIPIDSMVQIIPPLTGAPPGKAPSALTITATAGANSITVDWSGAGSDVTQYFVQYRTTTGPGPWTTYLATNGLNPTASPVVIDGLNGGVSYDVQIWAVNGSGITESNIASATPTGGLYGYVQGGTTLQSWNQGNVVTLNNVTQGHMLVMASASYNTTTTITDTQGNVWTKAVNSASGTGSYFAEVWTAIAKATGNVTITRDGNGIWTALEYAGVTTVGTTGHNTNTGSAALDCEMAAATSGVPSILMLVGAEGNNKSFQNNTAVGPGLTQRSTNNAGSSGCLVGDLITDAALQWTLYGQIPASTSWEAVTVELK